MKTFTLVPSTNRGRYALDTPDGPDLTCGCPISICLGGYWIAGYVEHALRLYTINAGQACGGYFFNSQTGTICGLCVGMQVRLETDAPRRGTHDEYDNLD